MKAPSAEDAQQNPAKRAEEQKEESLRLIDSSVWIRADRKQNKSIRERLQALIYAGLARICWPIHAELLIGVKDQEQWTTVDEGLSAIEHAPIGDNTWRQASTWGWKLARRGETVPVVDLLIAAAAVEANLILWTIDSDFDRIASISNLRRDRFGAERRPTVLPSTTR